MLNDPAEYIGKAVEQQLGVDHFYLPAHATLFGVLLDCYHKNVEIELVGLVQRLADRGLLDRVGGPQAVYEIFTYAPNSGHFERHLQVVKDKFVLRSIIRTCNESIALANDSPEEVGELLDKVESSVLGIRELTESQAGKTTAQVVHEVLDQIEELLSGGGGIQGVPTGYKDLDRLSNGLKPGEMFVIAARPSMGKTSLVMNIVEHVCLDQGIPTLVFSCEMKSEQLVQRLLFSRSRFPGSKLHDGKQPNKIEIQRLKRVSEELCESKLFLDDTPGISIHEVRAKARRRKRDDGIGLLAIDYLQLMRSHSRQAENSREREIADISAGVKGIAKELDIPVIVLSQLNRGPETRTGKNLGLPRLSDLRESGAIEQDADLVGLLYRPDYYADAEEERQDETGKAELIIAKNRNGQTGNVPLTFLAELMRFEARANTPEPAH
jgi:replicative DNA helicase